jgi:predicted  nucleic acid-binding Zn-ribbon protein
VARAIDPEVTGKNREFLIMDSEIDSEVFDLIKRLQQLQEKAEALAAHQHDLREQLKTAEQKARALHQKILEEQSGTGGEG